MAAGLHDLGLGGEDLVEADQRSAARLTRHAQHRPGESPAEYSRTREHFSLPPAEAAGGSDVTLGRRPKLADEVETTP